jgi:transposase
VTEDVPWARNGSAFTRPFEDAVGLLAQRTDKTTVSMLFGIAWVTVGRIAERLVAELLDPDRLLGLRRISVDEISFRKHHRYLTVVSDHDTGNVVWVGEGSCAKTLKGFFQSLPQQARESIEIVTMDMSAAYRKAVTESLPGATIAFDHFHIAKLANEALNEVRRELVREARQQDPKEAKRIKNMLWPLAYRLDNLPDKHLPRLHDLDPRGPLGRAWLLKEQLLEVLRCRGAPWIQQGLQQWIAWAARSRLPSFVRLGRTIRAHLPGVLAFMTNQVNNGRAEGINNKLRLLSHRAYGFHSAAPLIATIYLCCGGVQMPINSHLL